MLSARSRLNEAFGADFTVSFVHVLSKKKNPQYNLVRLAFMFILVETVLKYTFMWGCHGCDCKVVSLNLAHGGGTRYNIM